MKGIAITSRGPVAGTALAVLVAGLAGCAHVSEDDFESRLTTLRADVSEEITQGDRQVQQDLGARIDGIEDRIDALDRDLQSLEQEFDATVERLETALRFNVPVHFAFDDATVRQQDREILDRFGGVVDRYYPDALVTVEGFTDPAGSEAYNQRLGQRRADAVKSYLVDRTDLRPNRVRAVSYGESQPRQVAEGETGPGQDGWQNRRVVLVIDHGGAGVSSGPVVTVPDLEGTGGN